MDKITYKIDGLDCAEEVAVLKKVVGNVPGIHQLAFNILHAKMIVTYDPQQIDSGEILALIASTGMKGTPWESRALHEHTTLKSRFGRLFFTGLSALFLLTAMALSFFHASFPQVFYGLSIAAAFVYVLPKVGISIRQLRADIHLLMVIAVCGALAIGEWFEGASVAFLFSVALLLEQWSIERARKAIGSLLQLTPTLARIIDPQSGHLIEMEVEKIGIGSHILIRPGEKVPLDAVVIKGSSSVDQSPLTGESVPVTKEIGDDVFAGTLNEDGALECKVTKISSETTLSRMIHLVEEARSKSSPSEQWVDKFAKIYTPLMLLAAIAIIVIPPLLFSAPWASSIYRGLVLLIIACPCALVISTPVSIIAALTSAARHGILIKGGIYLEEVGQIKALALDKTGTLTYGHPEVQQIVPLGGLTKEELLERAAALEQPSQHPLARAILRKAEADNIPFARAENFQAIKGKGAKATYKGQLFWIGSHRFMHEQGQETQEVHEKALALEDVGHSIVAIGNESMVCGLISIADSPRKFIHETLQSIKELGIEEIVMLTGDNQPTAAALAAHTGVDTYHADLLPEDKVSAVLRLKEKWQKVAMVGDGVNDAPAIAVADVGIAMAGMGTDAAIETASIALMGDDLSKLPWLIRHSRKTLTIIQQNIGFALGVKALFIVLALVNMATLWMAIGADTGATLLVVFNALRLLNRK